MSLSKLAVDLDNISKLDDEPNDVGGLTAEDLKVQFDKAGNAIKTFINDTLTKEIDEQKADKSEVQDIVLGQIPDGTITTAKLSTGLNTAISSAAPNALSVELAGLLGLSGNPLISDALAKLSGSALKTFAFYSATMPSSANWYSVAYGNGKFVAVATNGSTAAAYSTDGITWTAATLPSSANWHSVTYGNGKFVTVANNSTAAAYSTDGITWTAATLPSSASWYSVAYGNGKFVAIANGSTSAAYSTDGITWTAATLPSSAYWLSVTYGNGKFVTVANNSTAAAYSTDGITWTAATLPSSKQWYSVCYGTDKFVAVSLGPSTSAAYSADGITWTAATLPSSANWQSVTYGNGKFVAVASNGNNAAYSADGITWTAFPSPGYPSWQSIAYGNGKFVAVAYASSTAAYTGDALIDVYGNAISLAYAKIATGSYTGTGTYGSGNPNIITTPFAPKLAIIMGPNTGELYTVIMVFGSQRGAMIDNNSSTGSTSSYMERCTFSNDSLSWYSTGNAALQLNTSSALYSYCIIG